MRPDHSLFTVEHYETEYAGRQLLHGAIAKWARETPSQVALIEFDTGRQFTYAEVEAHVTAIIYGLLARGFRPGDFLATSLPLLAEHVLLEYACFAVGVVHAPLDLRLKAPEVLRLIESIRPKGYAFLGKTPAADFGELGRVVRRTCTSVEHFFQFTSDDPLDFAMSASAFFTSAAKTAAEAEGQQSASALWQLKREVAAGVRPDSGAQVIFTTGSTGLPKPALLSHRNITSQNVCLAAGFELDANSRMLVNLPPSHVGCQGEALMTTLFVGGTAVLLNTFDAVKSLEAIQALKVNCFGQIPAMFELEWRLPNFGDYDLSSVDRLLYGGQQVTAPFVERLLAMGPRVGTGLGLTEMAGFVTYTGLTREPSKLLDSVGWDMPITPLTIRQPMSADGLAGSEVPDGEEGEICFSGPQVFVDYVGSPEAYARTVSREGICYTGDLGVKSSRGLLFKGRSKLVIKPKGYQVHPAEIENHFAVLKDRVAACGAVGAPHDVFGEGVVLFVERTTGAQITAEDLGHHAQGIAAYARPLCYVFIKPGEFPLNRVNKTDYVHLRERALAEVETLRTRGGWDR